MQAAARTTILTEQQRMQNVFDALTRERVAFLFNLAGSPGSRSERHDQYITVADRLGTDRWVGEHVGHVDTDGGYWGEDGRLYWGRGQHDWNCRQICSNRHGTPGGTLHWSFNHHRPELAELLVRLFTEHGFSAQWSGDLSDCVAVDLSAPQG